MLDVRVYRAAFLPLLLALFVAAFSLGPRPAPATTTLAADAFDGARASAVLRDLARRHPERPPGSAAEEALGGRVERTLRGNGFEVSRRVTRARPAGGARDLTTVVGVRPGVSSRRLVVVADRAARGAPATAALSGTAALLELSRIFRATAPRDPTDPRGRGGGRAVGRSLRRTLVLVSTSGAGLGAGEAAARAVAGAGGPQEEVDGVLVLGDLAGAELRRPQVVAWSDGGAQAPVGLRRTVEAAVRAEVGTPAGSPRASAQWLHRVVPLTVSAQGELVAAGLPAVLLQASGERGPAADAAVSAPRFAAFGRAALRSLSAVDEARPPVAGRPGPFAREAGGIVTLRRLLPDWVVRLLVGAALLPALFAALDGFFRARRRGLPAGGWLAWAAVGALPLLLFYVWLRGLALTGALGAPAAPTAPGALPLGGGEIAALVSAVLVLALAVLVLRRFALPRFAPRGDAAAGAGAAAVGLLLTGTAALVWVANPYAAALLVPAAHGWLLAAGSTRVRPALGIALVVLGLLPLGLALVATARALGLDPAQTAWLGVLVAAGGHLGPGAAAALALLASCLGSTLAVLGARRRLVRIGAATPETPALRTRGPASYAGPGSLGGTDSALRR